MPSSKNLDATSQDAQLPRTIQEFWKLADQEKSLAEYRIDANLRYLRSVPLDTLRRVLVQYRFFTIYYITDLSLLVARLPFGVLRSSLAHFLSEELGSGDERQAHPSLYDNFLRSVGVPPQAFDQPLKRNIALLEDLRGELTSRSVAYAIGLRGMGGECLCQIYLSALHEHFSQNPAIQEFKELIAWKFWEIHTGEEDIHHRELTRRAIDKVLDRNPEMIPDLAAGYLRSKAAWDAFWNGIYDDAYPKLRSA